MGPLHTRRSGKKSKSRSKTPSSAAAKFLRRQAAQGRRLHKGFYSADRSGGRRPRVAHDPGGSLRSRAARAVKDLDEAIEQANSSIYGLGSSIWTRDINAPKARKRSRPAIPGSTRAYRLRRAAFRRRQAERLGKEHGDEAIEYYTDSKSVVIATETHSEIVGGE